MERLVTLLIGYAFGNIQAAYLIGKARGIDIRDYGSGNAGTTNALRVMGKKTGAAVLAIDAAKCAAAILLAGSLFAASRPELTYLLKVIALAGCVLGHNYPFYMNFRGGKGVAVMLGFVLCFYPGTFWFALACFLIPLALTRYVSLSSLVVYAGLMPWLFFHAQRGDFAPATAAVNAEMLTIYLLLAVMAFVRHRGNIVKLKNGTERKLSLFSREKKE